MLVAQFGATGGTRTYALALLRLLAQQGAQVVFVSDGPINDQEMAAVVEALGFEFVTLADLVPQRRPSIGERFWGAYAEELAIREASALSVLVKERSIQRVIASVGTPGSLRASMRVLEHGLYLLHTYPHGLRAHLHGHLHTINPLPPSTRVVAVSEYTRHAVSRLWHVPPEASTTILSTAGPCIPAPSPSQYPVVLCAGHVEDYKNPEGWIKVARLVLSMPGNERTQFTWVGDGSKLRKCRDRVDKLAIADRVQFVGHANDMDSWYSGASVYTQFSSVESLGLGVLDAARRGIPQVVTNVGGLTEAVEHGVSGLIVPHDDWEAAAAAISQLLRDAAEHQRLGRGAQLRYARLFSPEAWTAAWLALLDPSTLGHS